MKLKYATVLTVAGSLISGAANADALIDVYAGATIGVGAATIFENKHNSTDTAHSYGAVLGMDVPLVRIELEYDYLNNKEYDMHLGMINLYGKLPTTVVHPYLGVGVGTAFDGAVNITPDATVKTNSGTAYQTMIGLTFDLPVLPFKVDTEGRAIYVPNFYTIADTNPDLLQYELRVKLRYIF